MNERETVRCFEDAGLRPSPCGLNADWWCMAWHFGPGKPNITDGGLYVLDVENDDPETFMVVRYFPSFYDVEGREDDAYVNVTEDPVTLEAAIRLVKEILPGWVSWPTTT